MMAEHKTFAGLRNELAEYFNNNTNINIDDVKLMMESYVTNRKDWEIYAIFDKNQSYTRNLVLHVGGKFDLIVLCWNKNRGSPIHNHADSHCWMKILEGTATEERYDCPKPAAEDTEMKPIKTMNYKTNECAYISDKIGLHRVLNNSSSEDLVTLHLYSPPILKCEVFDEATGQHETHCMTFYSENGKLK